MDGHLGRDRGLGEGDGVAGVTHFDDSIEADPGPWKSGGAKFAANWREQTSVANRRGLMGHTMIHHQRAFGLSAPMGRGREHLEPSLGRRVKSGERFDGLSHFPRSRMPAIEKSLDASALSLGKGEDQTRYWMDK
jgi:hypothetical protein